MAGIGQCGVCLFLCVNWKVVLGILDIGVGVVKDDFAQRATIQTARIQQDPSAEGGDDCLYDYQCLDPETYGRHICIRTSDCEENFHCLDEVCYPIECRDDSECEESFVCFVEIYTCEEAMPTCEGDLYCENGSCENDDDCEDGFTCFEGGCQFIECSEDTDCAALFCEDWDFECLLSMGSAFTCLDGLCQ